MGKIIDIQPVTQADLDCIRKQIAAWPVLPDVAVEIVDGIAYFYPRSRRSKAGTPIAMMPEEDFKKLRDYHA